MRRELSQAFLAVLSNAHNKTYVVTFKEEQACLELWLKDKSVNEDVLRGIEISLTKISEALGKLAALEKGKTCESPAEESDARPTKNS